MKAFIGRYRGGRSLFLAALAFVVFLTGGPAWANGLVLCICHDGHVSLESTCQPVQCCPGDLSIEGASDAGSSAACSDASEDHPCVDVPLLMPSGFVQLVPARAFKAPSVELIAIPGKTAASLAPDSGSTGGVAANPGFQSTNTRLKQITVLII